MRVIALILLIALFLLPVHLDAKGPEFYTLQTGSLTTIPAAVEQFDAVMMGLMGINGIALDYLRIEKIGKFYTVRVGKFIDYMSAEVFLQAARAHLTGAIILKAYIREDRIVKLYGEDVADEGAIIDDKHLPPADFKETHEEILPGNAEPAEAPSIPEQTKEIAGEEIADQKTEKISSMEPEIVRNPGTFSNVRGRFYVSDYYSTDSDDYDFHVLSGRVNLYKRRETPGFYFEFDGKARKEIIEGDLRGKVPRYKIDAAWIGYEFPNRKIRIIGGRQYINELYNTEIDGLNAKYLFRKWLVIGVFGGLAPDKFDDSLNDDFKSVGLYAFLKTDDHNVSLGYENLTYNGEPDREYFSIRAYSRFYKKLRLNALSSISKNQLTDSFEMETANANLTYSYSKKLRFNAFANYYRTIKYYESSKFYFEFSDTDDNFLLVNNPQTRAGIRVDYKVAKGLKVYGSTAYQYRKLDDEDSTRFTGGIRKYDLYGFDLSGRYTYIDNYSSRDNEYNVEIYRNIMNKFDVSIYASYEETKLDLENAYTSGSRTYGATLYWPITKIIYLSMFLEYLDDEDFNSTSLFTQLGYKLIP